jgi:response regulator RpfG family c-di-GMP phosphodiesterase
MRRSPASASWWWTTTATPPTPSGLLLEADGADVRVVYDGRAALAMAESFLPSSVLLDIGMPGMDGYEVARRLRQDERFASLRIVALTGWGQDAGIKTVRPVPGSATGRPAGRPA